METLDELIELAEDTPGPVQYWDPLKLSEKEFCGESNDATIGFLPDYSSFWHMPRRVHGITSVGC